MKDENENIVSIRNVSKSYKINEHSSVGVKDVNFEAKPGELVLFLGPSGSGKTTLLTLIAGLLQPSEGSISLFDKKNETYSNVERRNFELKKSDLYFKHSF